MANLKYVFTIRWLKEQFELADKDDSGTLEEKECSELLHALNLNISKKQIGIQFRVCLFTYHLSARCP